MVSHYAFVLLLFLDTLLHFGESELLVEVLDLIDQGLVLVDTFLVELLKRLKLSKFIEVDCCMRTLRLNRSVQQRLSTKESSECQLIKKIKQVLNHVRILAWLIIKLDQIALKMGNVLLILLLCEQLSFEAHYFDLVYPVVIGLFDGF